MQILYFDGQFDDARLGVTLACTAAAAGAATINYTEVVRLIKVSCYCGQTAQALLRTLPGTHAKGPHTRHTQMKRPGSMACLGS